MLKVAKFGGSSVANASQINKIKNIVEQDPNRRIVITSAIGKDSKNQAKITDLLFLLYAHIEYGIDHKTIFDSIKERFIKVKEELELSFDLEKEFEIIESQLNKSIQKDYLVSRGEYLTAKILAEVLNYDFVDATEVICVNYDGTVNYDLTNNNLNEIMKKHNRIVIPGYYAVAPNNLIKLFSRGGSDLTGSIIAKIVKADLYENWTDVNGIYVVDPILVENSKRIKNITYDELRELSYRGAKVLHQESVIPLENLEIPILIKNTNNPDIYGTKISNSSDEHQDIITGIAGKKDYTSFNITKDNVKPIANVLKDVLDLFIRYKLNIEHIPTGVDTFSVITNTHDTKDMYFDIINEMRNIEGIVDLSLEDDISLVAIVGKKMSRIPGVAGRIFSCLGKKNINIKVIAQASTEISIIIGVANKDYKDTIKTIYNEFFTGEQNGEY